MRWAILLSVLGMASTACGGDGPTVEHRFVAAVTACETLEWARARDDLLQSGDTAEAERYASGRCFVVEPGRAVRVERSEGRLPGGSEHWVEVATPDGAALEHLASAELRKAIGQPVRTRGWVRRSDLETPPQ